MDPKNKDAVEITRLASSTSDDAEWVGGFFATAVTVPSARP